MHCIKNKYYSNLRCDAMSTFHPFAARRSGQGAALGDARLTANRRARGRRALPLLRVGLAPPRGRQRRVAGRAGARAGGATASAEGGEADGARGASRGAARRRRLAVALQLASGAARRG